MHVFTSILLAAVFLAGSARAQGNCGDCLSLSSQMSGCSSSTSTDYTSCLSAICSQKFLNSVGACTTCPGQTSYETMSESSSIDSIIQSCQTLNLGGTLCNPLKTGSNCPGYTPISPGTTAAATSTHSSSTNGGSSTPVGAIVGGCIGGLVVIAAVAFISYRMAKRKSATPNPHSTKPNYQPQNQPSIQNMQYNNQQPSSYAPDMAQPQSYAPDIGNQPYQYYSPRPLPPSQPQYGQPTQYNNFSPSPSPHPSLPPPLYNNQSPYTPDTGSTDVTKPTYGEPVNIEYEVKNATVQPYDHASGGPQQNYSGATPDAELPVAHNLYKPNV